MVAVVAITLTGCSNGDENVAMLSPTVTPVTVGARITPSPTPTEPPDYSSPPTPDIRTTPSTSAADAWSAKAEWQDYAIRDLSALWQSNCGVGNPASGLNPVRTGFDCVVAVMQAAGATPEAIAFLRAQGYFLSNFQELGVVDFGRGVAPWFNMGRPQQVLFLNGLPDAVEVTSTLLLHFERLRSGRPGAGISSYAEVMGRMPNQPPVAWVEYARLAGSEPRNGGQAITLEVPLQNGRPGPVLGYMPVEFVFSSTGILMESTMLPFRAP